MTRDDMRYFRDRDVSSAIGTSLIAAGRESGYGIT
jgi:hypothetical protein